MIRTSTALVLACASMSPPSLCPSIFRVKVRMGSVPTPPPLTSTPPTGLEVVRPTACCSSLRFLPPPLREPPRSSMAAALKSSVTSWGTFPGLALTSGLFKRCSPWKTTPRLKSQGTA